MVGVAGIIFVLLPESPWWLVGKDRPEKAAQVLRLCCGRVQGYNVDEQIGIMTATITEERRLAERNRSQGAWAVFQGRNLLRFLIAGWPKIVQQFVGLSVFNTYATYFCTPPSQSHTTPMINPDI